MHAATGTWCSTPSTSSGRRRDRLGARPRLCGGVAQRRYHASRGKPSGSQGGKGANQGVAAASQGSSVVLIAAVGDDEQGRSSLDHLADRGVDIGSVRLLDETHTGTAMVLVAEDGEMGPTLLRAEPSADARRRRFATTPLTHVDVLVPNRPELAELVGQAQAETLEDLDRCAKRLAFAGTLVVTLGRQGALIYGPHGRKRLAHVPAAHVEAVDTTSAVTRSAA